MFQRNIMFSSPSNAGSFPWTPIFSLGLILIAFGFTIIAYPEILVVLVSGFFLFTGFSCLMISLQLRRASKNLGQSRKFDSKKFDDIEIL